MILLSKSGNFDGFRFLYLRPPLRCKLGRPWEQACDKENSLDEIRIEGAFLPAKENRRQGWDQAMRERGQWQLEAKKPEESKQAEGEETAESSQSPKTEEAQSVFFNCFGCQANIFSSTKWCNRHQQKVRRWTFQCNQGIFIKRRTNFRGSWEVAAKRTCRAPGKSCASFFKVDYLD